MKKDFAAWYRALPSEQRDLFAERSGLKRASIESHFLTPHRIPRAAAMKRMALASGDFTVAELAAWFYEATLERQARQPQQPGRLSP